MTDVVATKKRVRLMAVINTLAALAALVAAVGYFKLGLEWALLVFAGALLTGFGAQIWLIASLKRANKGV